MEEEKLIRAKVLKIEENIVLLALADGQILKVKRRILSSCSADGTSLFFTL